MSHGQYMPSYVESRGVSHISRLEVCRISVDHTIEDFMLPMPFEKLIRREPPFTAFSEISIDCL